DEIAERAAVGDLHREKAIAVALAYVEDTAHVRMADWATEAELSREPLRPALIVDELLLEHLHRYDRLRRSVERAQHDPTAALPHDRLELVPPRQHHATLDVRHPFPDHRRAGHRRHARVVERLLVALLGREVFPHLTFAPKRTGSRQAFQPGTGGAQAF